MNNREYYNSVNNEYKLAAETMEMNERFSEKCLIAIMDLVPERAEALEALVEAFAEYKIRFDRANETLSKAGFTEDQIWHLRVGYNEIMEEADKIYYR